MGRTCGEPDEIELTRHGGGIVRLGFTSQGECEEQAYLLRGMVGTCQGTGKLMSNQADDFACVEEGDHVLLGNAGRSVPLLINQACLICSTKAQHG